MLTRCSAQDEGRLSEKAAARILLEVLKVVDACHSAGFVHGGEPWPATLARPCLGLAGDPTPGVASCWSDRACAADVKPANFVLKLHHSRPSRALETGRGLQGSWLKAIDFGMPYSQMPSAGALSYTCLCLLPSTHT